MRVVAMQPYFFPYAGYFRLALASDVFIVLDNVQYTRRSWISRNSFLKKSGQSDWLTLPIAHSPRNETKIYDVKFAQNIDWEKEVKKFEIHNQISKILEAFPYFLSTQGILLDYLRKGLLDTCKSLRIDIEIVNASELLEKGDLKGEEYIIQLCRTLQAKQYINLAGGKELYSQETFSRNGIELKILNEYKGSTKNILERLMSEEPRDVRKEITLNTIL
jgi:hypothetical protein